MVARGRKQKASLLQGNLRETLETHFAGIISEKRHNFDPSTPPGCERQTDKQKGGLSPVQLSF
jgi:hypothetical protein